MNIPFIGKQVYEVLTTIDVRTDIDRDARVWGITKIKPQKL